MRNILHFNNTNTLENLNLEQRGYYKVENVIFNKNSGRRKNP